MLAVNSIVITPALLRQITDIDEFKGLWTGLERHTTGLNLLGDVAGYGAAFGEILGPLQSRPITPDTIRALHAVQTKTKGAAPYKTATDVTLEIKSHGATIGTLETADPDQVAPLLEKLCVWLNTELEAKTATLHPLLTLALFTAIFLQIAPFETGNQTTARFLITLILLKSGYLYAPYATLDAAINDRGEEIFHALKHNQRSLENGRPDWSVWLSCFMTLLQEQKDTLHSRLYEKKTDLSHLSTLSGKIMDLFKTHKRLQMKEIIKLTNGRRATIKLRLGELIQNGYLKRHGQARATWYALN